MNITKQEFDKRLEAQYQSGYAMGQRNAREGWENEHAKALVKARAEANVSLMQSAASLTEGMARLVMAINTAEGRR